MRILLPLILFNFFCGCQFGLRDFMPAKEYETKPLRTESFLIDFQQECPEAYNLLQLKKTYLLSLNKVCEY